MPTNLTLSDIREAVRRKLDDSEFDATTIDEAANDFQYELFGNHRIRSMETTDNAISIGTGDTEVTLPDDIQTILSFTIFDSTSQPRAITDDYLDYNAFMRQYPNYTVVTPGRLQYWTDFGGQMRLSAPSDDDYTGSIDYLRRPNFMSSDDSSSEVPFAYKEMMTLGTLRRVMKINEDYAESSSETYDLNNLINMFVRNEGRGGIKTGPVVMNSRRRRTRSDW